MSSFNLRFTECNELFERVQLQFSFHGSFGNCVVGVHVDTHDVMGKRGVSFLVVRILDDVNHVKPNDN